MNKKLLSLWLVCCLGILGCATVESWLAESEDNPYNPSTVRIITGTIHEVEQGRGSDLDLKLISRDNEIFSVAVGPLWYLRRLNINFEEGEEITVVGSVIDAEEGTVIAQQIKRRRTKFVLRNQSGEPRWNQGALFNRSNSTPASSAAFAPVPGSF